MIKMLDFIEDGGKDETKQIISNEQDSGQTTRIIEEKSKSIKEQMKIDETKYKKLEMRERIVRYKLTLD